MTIRMLMGLVAILAAMPAAAQVRPMLGDRWEYRETYQDLVKPHARPNASIESRLASYRNTLGKIVFKGGLGLGFGLGLLSDTCLYDIAASIEFPGKIDCDDPLPVGKTWTGELYDGQRGTGQSHVVLRKQDVQVGSALHQATVIRTERTMASSPGEAPSGAVARVHSTYWYAPSLKGMARIERISVDAEGKPLFSETSELLHFYPASTPEPEPRATAEEEPERAAPPYTGPLAASHRRLLTSLAILVKQPRPLSRQRLRQLFGGTYQPQACPVSYSWCTYVNQSGDNARAHLSQFQVANPRSHARHDTGSVTFTVPSRPCLKKEALDHTVGRIAKQSPVPPAFDFFGAEPVRIPLLMEYRPIAIGERVLYGQLWLQDDCITFISLDFR